MPRPFLYQPDDFFIHSIPAESLFVTPSGTRSRITAANVSQAVLDLRVRALRLELHFVISPCRRQKLSNPERSRRFVSGFRIPITLLLPQLNEAWILIPVWYLKPSILFRTHLNYEVPFRRESGLRSNSLQRSNHYGNYEDFCLTLYRVALLPILQTSQSFPA